MMVITKRLNFLISAISLIVFIFTGSAVWAQNTVFTEYSLKALKVVEVDLERATVILESPEGEAALVSVGDIVGDKYFEVVEIKRLMVVLQSPPDDAGDTVTDVIPVIGIRSSTIPGLN